MRWSVFDESKTKDEKPLVKPYLKLRDDGDGTPDLYFVDNNGNNLGMIAYFSSEGVLKLNIHLKQNLVNKNVDISGLKFNADGSLITERF